MALLLPVLIAAGLLSDRIGRKPVLLLATVLGFVGAWLVNRTGDEIAPAFLIMAAAAVTFMTILRFRETYRAPFVGSSSAATAYA
jgi:MFS family permease